MEGEQAGSEGGGALTTQKVATKTRQIAPLALSSAVQTPDCREMATAAPEVQRQATESFTMVSSKRSPAVSTETCQRGVRIAKDEGEG